MTVDVYLGKILQMCGVRKDGLCLADCVQPGALILVDASYFARMTVSSKSWREAFVSLDERLRFLVDYITPADSPTKWPLVVVMDDRDEYPRERKEYVQVNRYENAPRYDVLPAANQLDAAIDVNMLLTTHGGHMLFMSAYITWTTLPLILIRKRSDPLLFCNTSSYPAFLKHSEIVVAMPLQFRPWADSSVHFANCNMPRSDVKEVDVMFPQRNGTYEWISECDTFAVWLAQKNLQVKPAHQVCLVVCDGDYIFACLLANLPIRILWPTAGDKTAFSRFDMELLFRLIPQPKRISVATCVYLAGSDFNPGLPVVSSAALISLTLGLAVGCYVVPDQNTGEYILPICNCLYKLMIDVVHPTTFALDFVKMKEFLDEVASLDKVFYMTKPKQLDADQKTAIVLSFDERRQRVRLAKRSIVPGFTYVSASTPNSNVFSDGFVFGPKDEWTVDKCIRMAHRFACYMAMAQ